MIVEFAIILGYGLICFGGGFAFALIVMPRHGRGGDAWASGTGSTATGGRGGGMSSGWMDGSGRSVPPPSVADAEWSGREEL